MTRRKSLIAALIASGLCVLAGTGRGAAASQPLDGLDFSAYAAGTSPAQGPPSPSDVRTRLQIIAPYTHWVRVYGCNSGTASSGATAHSLGMSVALGAYLDGSSKDQAELDCLVAAMHRGEVNIAVVGNEAVFSGSLTLTQLLTDIRYVRDRTSGLSIPITTGEPFKTWQSHPRLIAAVDIIFGHYYPFLQGDAVSAAIGDMQTAYRSLVADAQGKTVWVAETGWPSAGSAKGNAVPSDANARTYLNDFTSWAASNSVPYFYFASFDEAYKASPDYKAHYGLWDQNNNPKPYRPAA